MRITALPPAPRLDSVLTAWHPDPLLAVLVALAAVLYGLGVRRARRGGVAWPAARIVAFYVAGLGSLAIVGLGWPAVYAPVLFSVYATQAVALLMVVPFLLALGRPLELAKAALGPLGRGRLDRVLVSRGARFLTVPVVSPILLAVVPFALFLTPLTALTLRHAVVLSVVRLLLVLTGLAVLVPMWEADAVGVRWPYAVALLFAFIELLVDAVPGIVVRLQTHLLAGGWFGALGLPWGPRPLVDQQLGGDILWCVGEAVDVPFLALLVILWIRSDARDAARVDHALDAAALPELPLEPVLERPWWEREASVFGAREAEFRRSDP